MNPDQWRYLHTTGTTTGNRIAAIDGFAAWTSANLTRVFTGGIYRTDDTPVNRLGCTGLDRDPNLLFIGDEETVAENQLEVRTAGRNKRTARAPGIEPLHILIGDHPYLMQTRDGLVSSVTLDIGTGDKAKRIRTPAGNIVAVDQVAASLSFSDLGIPEVRFFGVFVGLYGMIQGSGSHFSGFVVY